MSTPPIQNPKSKIQNHITLLAYRRKSMVRSQADLISPERQARACQLWIEMHGDAYAIEWYEDVDGHRSGRDEKGRPGWQTLLAQLDRPDVAGVIADSFDRCYRNVHQFLNFLNRLEQTGKRLITVKEGLDTTSTLGRAIVTILMVIYQLESDQTSDRMAANVKYKREVLGRHWGPTPFGCDRDDSGHLTPTARTYWLDPHTGAASNQQKDGWQQRRYHDALQAIYHIYSGGQHSHDATAAAANAAGWRYHPGPAAAEPRPFTRDDVRRLVSFWRLYRGDLPLGNITNNRNAPVLEGGHQPILPVELCDQVGQIKATRTHTYNRRSPAGPGHFYLLSGVLHCAVCGKKLKGYFQDGRRIYRHYGPKQGCPEKWLPADDIEAEVLAELTRLANPDLLAQIAAEAERLARELFSHDDHSRPLLAQLDQQRDRLARLEDLYLDGGIDLDRYYPRKAGIDQAIAELEAQLHAATQTVNFTQVLTRMTATLTQIPAATPETKKALVNSIYERLDAAAGHITHSVPRPWSRPFF